MLGVFGLEDDIVKICHTVVELMVEDAVDETLKYCRRVLEPEWHDVVLEEASWCLEGRLLFVALLILMLLKPAMRSTLVKILALLEAVSVGEIKGTGYSFLADR